MILTGASAYILFHFGKFLILRTHPLPKHAGLSLPLLLLLCPASFAQARGGLTPTVTPAPFDVLHYDARVEPDVVNKTVKGRVSIRLVARADNLGALEFDCGDLVIDAVRVGTKAERFERLERVVKVFLSRPARAGETCGSSSSITARRGAAYVSILSASWSTRSSRRASGWSA